MDNYINKLRMILSEYKDNVIVVKEVPEKLKTLVSKDLNTFLNYVEDAVLLKSLHSVIDKDLNSKTLLDMYKDKLILKEIEQLNKDFYLFENKEIYSKELKKEKHNLYYEFNIL